MSNNLTLTSASFDTAGKKFGTGALSGGYGIAPSGMISAFPMAWECWFKRSVAPSSLEVVMGQSGLGWFGVTTSGKMQFELGAAGKQVDFTSAATVTDGNWHHAAISANANGFVALLDGAVVGQSNAAPAGISMGISGSSSNGTGYLGVANHGGYYGITNFQFGGEIDEAAVWNYQKYTGAFTLPTASYTGSETGLLALWHLDGNGADSTGTQPSISAPAVAGVQVGGTTTVSGTFANGAPAGLSQVLDGTTTTVSSPTLTTTSGSGATAAGTYSYSIQTPAAGSHTLEVLGTGIYAATSTMTGFTTSSAPPVIVQPNDPAIAFSPYTWSGGKTINPGAYFRLCFTGNSIAVNFDVSAQSAPLPEVWIEIDGQTRQQFTLASTVTPAMPSAMSGWPKHVVELMVKSTSEFVSRWTPQNAAVVLTSIALANGGVQSRPAILTRNVLCYGDSITEGYHTVSALAQGSDTDGSDAALSWACALRRLLGAEIGVVGFGGTGLLNSGQGGVPPVGQSYIQLWSGAARSFSPSPSLIIINEGENDKAANAATFQAAFQAFLTALLTSVPACPVAVLRPFSGAQAAAIQAAIQVVGSPRLHYWDPTGLFDTTLSTDGQHPLGVANLAGIAPGVAGLVAPLLAGIVNRWSHA